MSFIIRIYNRYIISLTQFNNYNRLERRRKKNTRDNLRIADISGYMMCIYIWCLNSDMYLLSHMCILGQYQTFFNCTLLEAGTQIGLSSKEMANIYKQVHLFLDKSHFSFTKQYFNVGSRSLNNNCRYPRMRASAIAPSTLYHHRVALDGFIQKLDDEGRVLWKTPYESPVCEPSRETDLPVIERMHMNENWVHVHVFSSVGVFFFFNNKHISFSILHCKKKTNRKSSTWINRKSSTWIKAFLTEVGGSITPYPSLLLCG